MDWQHLPNGLLRYDELLNTLLAIWKTHYGIMSRLSSSNYSRGYNAGFEEGLEAIAQAAGLTEAFEASKAIHCNNIQARLDAHIEIVDMENRLVK